MKATVAAMALGAAALVSAAPHGHAIHKHRRAADVEKREPLVGLSSKDFSRLNAVEGKGFGSDALTPQKVQFGKNVDGDNDKGPVTINGQGPFLVEVTNESPDDIILVSWSNLGKANPWDAAFVTQASAPPDITHTVACNTTLTLSFDPEQAPGNSISGGMAGIYPDTILDNGMISDTWVEYTFKNTDAFSTTDVSRLVNFNGHDVEVHNYASKDDAEPACSSTMTVCSFVCDDGSNSCQYGGKLQNCPVGTPGTVSDESGANGGCGGMRQDGGYMRVIFK